MSSLRTAAFVLIALAAVGVAVVSSRYLAPGMPNGAPEVIANRFAAPWLAIHAGFAALALAIGPLQFLRGLRNRRPAAHRLIGFAYLFSCLAGGVSGLALAAGTTAGPVAAAGFGLLAVAWLGATARGYQLAAARRFVDHRAWMVRSYALTLAAVTLRLQLGAVGVLQLDFAPAYLAISFACWIPNLILAELYLLATQNQPASRSAG